VLEKGSEAHRGAARRDDDKVHASARHEQQGERQTATVAARRVCASTWQRKSTLPRTPGHVAAT
jgi:hypothetical protein